MEFNDRRSGNVYNLSWYRDKKRGRVTKQTVRAIGAGAMTPREITLNHIRTKHGLMPGAFQGMPADQISRVHDDLHDESSWIERHSHDA